MDVAMLKGIGHGIARADAGFARALDTLGDDVAGAAELTDDAARTLDATAASAPEGLLDGATAQAREAVELLHAGQATRAQSSIDAARGALRETSTSLGFDLDELMTRHGMAAAEQLDAAPATARHVVGTGDDASVRGRIAGELGDDLDPHARGNGTRTEDQATELRGRVRDELGSVFAPLADDLVQSARALRDVPLDALPRAGSEATVGAYEGTRIGRWLRMRVDVAGSRSLLQRADERATSIQQIPGREHKHGLDLVAPVGEYGAPMARALVEAGRVLDAIALQKLRPAADALTAKHAGTLDDWTFQKDSLEALMEGIGTFAGTTGLLTSKRVPGMNGSQLLDAIGEGHVLERTAKGPLGLAGPMFFKGWVPKEPLALNAKGKLRLGDGFDALEKATRARRRTNRIITTPQTRQTHKGCPIVKPRLEVERAEGPHVNRETYLTSIGREYLHLARRFYERELAAAT